MINNLLFFRCSRLRSCVVACFPAFSTSFWCLLSSASCDRTLLLKSPILFPSTVKRRLSSFSCCRRILSSSLVALASCAAFLFSAWRSRAYWIFFGLWKIALPSSGAWSWSCNGFPHCRFFSSSRAFSWPHTPLFNKNVLCGNVHNVSSSFRTLWSWTVETTCLRSFSMWHQSSAFNIDWENSLEKGLSLSFLVKRAKTSSGSQGCKPALFRTLLIFLIVKALFQLGQNSLKKSRLVILQIPWQSCKNRSM